MTECKLKDEKPVLCVSAALIADVVEAVDGRMLNFDEGRDAS